MAIYIAHTAADAGVAKSLARFLRGQSLPVRLVGVERMTMAAKQADNMILLWSRSMAARFGAMRNPWSSPSLTGQMIVVDIDGAKTPPDTVAAVDARSSGLRKARAWRSVTALAKHRNAPQFKMEVEAAPVGKPVERLVESPAYSGKSKTQYVSAYGFGLVLLALMLGALVILKPELF